MQVRALCLTEYSRDRPPLFIAVAHCVAHLTSTLVCSEQHRRGHEWLAAEAITAEEALRLMTINGAYLLFMEDEVGSLKPGKLADMIVLTDNPLTIDPDALKDLEVLMTMVGGQVEYCGDDSLCPTQALQATSGGT